MKTDAPWKINLLTTFGVVEMVLCSGVIYGWANMVLILKDEDYFKDLCARGNSTTMNSTDKEDSDDECARQDDRLTLAFTIAVFSFNLAGFVGGLLFDRFGTRATRLIACFFFFLAGVFGFFLEKDTANLIFAVMASLGFAGMIDSITLFQIAVLHPSHRLAVSSSLSGALDSSSVVFLLFKLCYDAGANFRWILIGYSVIAIVLVLANTFVFLPKTSISSELEELEKARARAIVELGTVNPAMEAEDEKHSKKPKTEDSDAKKQDGENSNGWRHLLTGKYLWLVYYLGFVQLRLWFFVGSLNTFLEFRSDNNEDEVDRYSRSFGITQFFGFLFAPITGIVMDLRPKNIANPYFGPILSFIIANLLCLLLGILVLVPVLEIQYLSFAVQVAMRAFLYASTVSFLLRAFPTVHYGKLYGVCTLAAAILSLLQYPAFIILDGPFDGDPYWVNLGFLVLSFTGFGLPLYLWLSKSDEESGEITTSF